MAAANQLLDKQDNKQPAGLYYLFFAELWERFSFYGMRALLVLYMTKELLFNDQKAGAIYGAYGALVYLAPVLGGYLADHFLGYRLAILLGGVTMALGHFTLAIQNDYAFYTALALLAVGNGFFKPNISSLVGRLYRENDPRRDAGFMLFYMGVNIGAFGQLACAALGETVGWHYGFGLAGVGMLVGLAVFVFGQRKRVFNNEGLPPSDDALYKKRFAGLSAFALIVALAVALVPFFAVMINSTMTFGDMISPSLPGFLASMNILGFLIYTVSAGMVLYLIYYAFTLPKVERERLLLVVILVTFSTMFWAFFEQAGSSITLFTERNVDRNFFGWDVPTSVWQSVNPMFIILLTFPFSAMWPFLDQYKLNPSVPAKFGLGLVLLGLGFWVLAAAAGFATTEGIVPIWFLILGYFFHTTGELCLSPVGLSMITKLSPAKMVGLIMGFWFLSSSVGHKIGGQLAGEMSGNDAAGNVLPAAQTLPIYTESFNQIAIVSLMTGVILFTASPFLRKWMHGVK